MIGFVTNVLVANMLSKQEADAYIVALSIVSLGAVAGSLGLPKTVVGLVAENMGVDRPERALQVIRTVLVLGLLGTSGVSLAYLLVGDLVSNLLNAPALVALTGLMAGWIAIAVVQEITAETFRGFHDWSTRAGRSPATTSSARPAPTGWPPSPGLGSSKPPTPWCNRGSSVWTRPSGSRRSSWTTTRPASRDAPRPCRGSCSRTWTRSDGDPPWRRR
jgi:hypothetical protein